MISFAIALFHISIRYQERLLAAMALSCEKGIEKAVVDWLTVCCQVCISLGCHNIFAIKIVFCLYSIVNSTKLKK